jgi:hypothetical protein
MPKLGEAHKRLRYTQEGQRTANENEQIADKLPQHGEIRWQFATSTPAAPERFI